MDVQLVGGCASVWGVVFGLALGMTSAGGRRDARPASDDLAAARRSIEAWLETLPVIGELERRDRREVLRTACLRELPALLDVVTLGLSSGLSFDAALELYCERYDNELARSFGEAMLSWRIGAQSRADALEGLADELDVGALRSFASTVTQSLEFGSPLASALEVQAQAIREEQRSQMEEEIEKVPVKMLIPLGTLIVPAMLLAILGPLLGSSLSLG